MRTRAWNPLALVRDAVRNSPWIAMAVALHLIVIAIATVAVTRTQIRTDDDAEIVLTTRERAPTQPEPIVVPEIVRHPIPDDQERELVDTPEWIPTDIEQAAPDEIVGDPTALLENADGGGEISSTATGVGDKGIKGSGSTPFQNRKVGVRPKGDGGRGPSEASERAVLEGLRWLARHQNSNGSWGAASLRERCTGDDSCASLHANPTEHYDVGLTGLALLAYLGAGFGHDAKQTITDPITGEKRRVGDIVKGGLRWLVARQSPEGAFSRPRAHMYNEALATMALCEAYGLTRNRAWREPAQKAARFVAQAQRPSPLGQGLWGWRYAPRQEVEDQRRETGDTAAYERELHESDTSVTAWALMALKSARLSGLDVPEENFDGAVAFARWATADDGLVGYLDPRGAGATVTGPDDHFRYHTAGMSALGMCIRIFAEHDASDPFLELGARRLVADLPAIAADELSVDYYYWYYGSLALNQFDGPDSPRRGSRYWNAWNRAMVDSVLALQDETARSCRRGGWTTRDRSWHSGGPIYATALNVLTLEVYYRYENAFGAARGARPESKPR